MLPMQQRALPVPLPVSQVPANISSLATTTVVSTSPIPVSSSSKPASAVSDSAASHSGATKFEVGEMPLLPDEVPKLVSTTSNNGRLAVRLVIEAYFGKELQKQCPVYGFNNRAVLLKKSVLALKTKLLNIFPQYLTSPVDFEPLWNKSVAAINHCEAECHAKKVIEIIIDYSTYIVGTD
uniref:BEN domain-containing protein n=1 Tax=Amphimedon queenslandica TaxID=400682 RepID=A0A1X7UIB5_AMPQE